MWLHPGIIQLFPNHLESSTINSPLPPKLVGTTADSKLLHTEQNILAYEPSQI